MFDGLVVMSGGHCTHPTGGPAICLKHKKTMRRKFGSQRDPQDTKFDQFNLKDFVT